MRGSSHSINRHFRCLQVLWYSRAASASLTEVIIEKLLDIMLIRESFATNTSSPAIMNIPSGYIAFHILSNDHAYCADILVKLSLAKTCRATECSFQLTLLLSIYSRCMASSTLFLCTFDPPFKISRHNLTPVSADFSTNFCSLRWILIP